MIYFKDESKFNHSHIVILRGLHFDSDTERDGKLALYIGHYMQPSPAPEQLSCEHLNGSLASRWLMSELLIIPSRIS